MASTTPSEYAAAQYGSYPIGGFLKSYQGRRVGSRSESPILKDELSFPEFVLRVKISRPQ